MLNYLVIRLTARCRNQRGATAVEYGLIVAGIALVCIPVLFGMGHVLKTVFEAESSRIQAPPTSN